LRNFFKVPGAVAPPIDIYSQTAYSIKMGEYDEEVEFTESAFQHKK